MLHISFFKFRFYLLGKNDWRNLRVRDFALFIGFDTLINLTHNNILSLYFVSTATNVAPLDLQMSIRQLLYFLETLFRVDGEVYCYSRSFLLLIYMYKVHHCPIS